MTLSIVSRAGEAPLEGRPAVVLIDGRSGSGKTSLGAGLAASLGAAALHLDDLYPGWEGLCAGSRAVAQALDALSYRRYDWADAAFAERVAIDPARPLVIEGCGAVTARNLAAAERFARLSSTERFARSSGDAAVWSVWLECPAPVRRERAIGRDGSVFAGQWERWAVQEDAQIAAERPLALVNEILHT